MSKFFIITAFLLQNLIPAKFDHYGVLVIPLGKIPTNVVYPEPVYQNGYSKWLVKNNYDNRPRESYQDQMRGMDNYDYDKDRDETGRIGPYRDMSSIYGDDKIVGGVEVDINLYPYHVAYGFNCAGSIIHERWVMTAGHCGTKSYIRVGSKFIHKGRKVPVKRGYVHPQWGANVKEHPFDYDFQLLELAEPLKFDDNVQPIQIARMEDMIVGTIITVTGWGYTYENGPYSNVLRAIRVPLISKNLCQNVPFPYYRGRLTRRMFCAGYSEGKVDACQGDSGGPAVANNRLLGVVSFGYGCATPGAYGVYGKVADVRDWIEETTGMKFD